MRRRAKRRKRSFSKMKTGAHKRPVVFWLSEEDQQKPPLPPPQQHKSSRIQIMSHPHPFPQPLFPKQPPHPFPPPQQHKIRMSQIILHPFPPLWHPHPQSQPQLVAATSLILVPPKYVWLQCYHMSGSLLMFLVFREKLNLKRILNKDKG